MRLNPGAFKYLYGADVHGPYVSADGAFYWAAICALAPGDKPSFAARVFRQVDDSPATEVPHGLPYTPNHVTLALTNGQLYATFLASDGSRADAVLVPGFTVAASTSPSLPPGYIAVPRTDLQQIASIAMRNIT
jgi:hypothetical protein